LLERKQVGEGLVCMPQSAAFEAPNRAGHTGQRAGNPDDHALPLFIGYIQPS